MGRRINLSAAIIVLICFFLPWIQLSCGGSSDTVSGFDLAREGRPLLWLVPILMLAVLLVGLLRAWKDQPRLAAIVSVISGTTSVILLNSERRRVVNGSALIPAQLTGWFWLSLIAAVAIVFTALLLLLRPRST